MKVKENEKLTEEKVSLQHQISRLNKAIQLLKNKTNNRENENTQFKVDHSVKTIVPGDQTILKMEKMPDAGYFRNILIDDKKDVSRPWVTQTISASCTWMV